MDSVSHPEIDTVSRRPGSGNHHAASDPVDDPQLILERPVRSSFPGNAKFVIVLLFVAFVVQTGALLVLRRHATVDLLDADEQEYWGIASSLLQGGLSEFPVTRTLGFPLTIAAIRSVVGDSYFRVQFVLTSLLIFLAPLTYWLARAVLVSERAARVSALCVLFWPVYLRLGVTLFSDNITLVLFVLYLNVFVSAWQSTGEESFPWALWLLSGALLGICIHFRPMYLLYSPIAFALALWNKEGFRRRLLSGSILTIGCLCVVLPWSTYVTLREGRFLLLCTNDGQTLSGGLNPTLAGMKEYTVHYTPEGRPFWWGPGSWVPPAATGYLTSEECANLPDIEINRLLKERARAWVFAHPREVAHLSVMKLAYMWGIYPFWWSMYSFWPALFKTLTGNCAILLLLAASAVSLVRLRRHLRELSIFWTLPLFVTLVALVSLGNWRYRMPGDIGLIALTAALLAYPEVKRFLSDPPVTKIENVSQGT